LRQYRKRIVLGKKKEKWGFPRLSGEVDEPSRGEH